MQPARAAQPLNVRTPPRCFRDASRARAALFALLMCLGAQPASAQSSDWVIFAHDSTLVGARATVHGDVVVQDACTASHLADSAELTLDVDASVLGSLTADSVSLRARASVSGGVIMNDFTADPSATTGSTPTSPAALPLDFMFGDPPDTAAPQNALSVTVTAGGSDELAPGEYETVTLASGSAEQPTSLVLGHGEYVLGDLILGDHAFFAFEADAFVIVTGRLSVGDASYVGLTTEPPAGLTYDQTGVIVLGQNGSDGAILSTPAAATFGTGSMANTQIWVPNGTLQIGADAFFMGRAAGRWVAIGTDAVVATPGSSCGHGIMPESVECWDGDLCTSDSCVSGACAYAEIPNCDASPPEWPQDAWLVAEPAGDREAALHWIPAVDLVGVTSYRLYRDGDYYGETDPTASAIVLEDVGYGAWKFSIEALDAAGNRSTMMHAADVILGDTLAPTWPCPMQTEAVHWKSIELGWSAALDNLAVAGYELRQDGVTVASLGVTETSFLVESLGVDSWYGFQLLARDAAGNVSGSGPSWSLRTQDTDPPVAVAGSSLFLSLDDGVLLVDWSVAAWTDDAGVAGYQVAVLAGGQQIYLGSLQPPSTFITVPVPAASSYEASVVALDAAGNPSTPLTASLAIATWTDPPTWETAKTLSVSNIGVTSARLDWTGASAVNGLSAFVVYEGTLERARTQDTPPSFGLDATGLSPETEYTLGVEALDAFGNVSDGGPSSTFTTLAAPVPSWPSESATWLEAISGSEIWVSWTTFTWWLGAEVLVSAFDTVTGTLVVEREMIPSSWSNITLGGLVQGREYRVILELLDPEWGTVSSPIEGLKSTLDVSWPPGAALAVRPDSLTSIALSWPPAIGSVLGYWIFLDGFHVGGGAPTTVPGSGVPETYLLTGLEPVSEHEIVVYASDDSGVIAMPPLSTHGTTRPLPWVAGLGGPGNDFVGAVIPHGNGGLLAAVQVSGNTATYDTPLGNGWSPTLEAAWSHHVQGVQYGFDGERSQDAAKTLVVSDAEVGIYSMLAHPDGTMSLHGSSTARHRFGDDPTGVESTQVGTWVARFDSGGGYVEHATFEGVQGTSVSDHGDGVYVAGTYASAVTGSGTSSSGFSYTNADAEADGFVASLDADGAVDWSSRIYGGGAVGITAVTTDADGNLWVAGCFASTATFTAPDSTVAFTLSTPAAAAAFVAAYQPDGTPIGAGQIDGALGTCAAGIVSTLNDEIWRVQLLPDQRPNGVSASVGTAWMG